MNQPIIEKFAHPPITEAVFIFNFSHAISIDKIKSLIKEGILFSKYPVVKPLIYHSVRIDRKPNSAATSYQGLQDGLIFQTEESNPQFILQIKKNGLSLHKVKNYTSWEDLVAVLEIVSSIMDKKFGSEIELKDIGVRYINHIPISNGQLLEEYFRLMPPSIEGVPTNINKFLLQLGVKENDLEGIIIETIADINSQLNFIIDLRVTKPLKNINIGIESILPSLTEIRNFKNQLFFSIITDKIKPSFK